MPKTSAGLLLHRDDGGVEVLLVHPGGPFWARKDAGAWSIPKGEYAPGEDPEVVARREFREEIGVDVPTGELVELGEIRQSGGKRVIAWALCADLDVSNIVSNTFEMEWPPKSGRMSTFPEVDRAEWFPIDEARVRVVAAQAILLDRLGDHLATG